MEMSDKVTFLLEFGCINKKLKVDSTTSPLELEKLAAERLSITRQVTLQYYDKDFHKWVVVDEDYKLTDRDTLKLVIVDEYGNKTVEGNLSEPPPNGKDTTQVATPESTTIPSSNQTAAAVSGWIDKIREGLTPGCQGMIFLVAMSSVKGANKDIKNMTDVFTKLNFAVYPLPNLLASEVKFLTQAIAESQFPRLKSFKYIAFHFAGHGGINSNGDSFIHAVEQSNESDRVYIANDIINVIQLGQKEKALLFFFDCCTVASSQVGNDRPPDINIKTRSNNTLFACASSFGKESVGVINGGLWTSALCKYLVNDESIGTILGKVEKEVKEKHGQTCTHTATGFDININLKASVKPEFESVLKKSPKQDHVVKLLNDHMHNPDRIGRLLGVDFAIRERIRKDYTITTAEGKMDTTVNYWIDEQTSDVTWEYFIKAMKDGSLNKLAGEIQRFIERDDIKQDYADVLEWVRK